MRPGLVMAVGLAALLGACAASPQRRQVTDLAQLIQLRAEATAAVLDGRARKQEGRRIAAELGRAQRDLTAGEYARAEAIMRAAKVYLGALR